MNAVSVQRLDLNATELTISGELGGRVSAKILVAQFPVDACQGSSEFLNVVAGQHLAPARSATLVMILLAFVTRERAGRTVSVRFVLTA